MARVTIIIEDKGSEGAYEVRMTPKASELMQGAYDKGALTAAESVALGFATALLNEKKNQRRGKGGTGIVLPFTR